MIQTQIFGHRGASGEAPENTLKAFALAAEQGAQGVELDVHPSGDGQLVIIHDETLERTTNGRGRVAELDYAALAALDAGQGERIPTLEEVLRLARGRLFVDIEIKDPGIEAPIAALIDRLAMTDQVAISSFYPASLAAMRATAPGLLRWLLSSSWGEQQWQTASELGVVGIAPRYPAIDRALVERATNQGLAVVAWTVNDEAEIRRLLDLQIGVIITDFPARGSRLKREHDTPSGSGSGG